MPYFTVQFPLKTEKYQEDILDKRFEIGRQIYNSLANVTQKQYKEMIKTKRYRNLLAALSDDKKQNKEIWKQIGEIRREYGFSEWGFFSLVKPMQHHFKKNIDNYTARAIASNLWRAYEKLLFGDGKAIHYKKYGTLNSLEGQSNASGIKVRDDNLVWNGLKIPIRIDYNNAYECQAMQSEIKYSRIVRKFVKTKYRYYIQILFKGLPPVKLNKETGERKHNIGTGDVGIDIGTSTVVISSETDVKIYELADKVPNLEKQKKVILRKMDRSMRAMNPDNYNPDGTVKMQGRKRVKWVKSNHYLRYQNQLKELYRKQTDVRKYQHECLANEIISMGDKLYVETIDFAELQRKPTETERNEATKDRQKLGFGKALANRAPSMLLTIIDRKLKKFDTMLFKINTTKVRASQFNHVDGTYTKKSLSQRWFDINGMRIQRNMYSAFLIMNIENDLETVDVAKCNDRFDTFKQLHDLEVQRLAGKKNLSCIAIK